MRQFGYSSGELGALFGAMAVTDLMAVGAASRAADRLQGMGDVRRAVVPGILGSAVACACIGLLASLAPLELPESGTDGCDDAPPQPMGPSQLESHQMLHALFLAGVALWAVATASIGPALPAFAAGGAPDTSRLGESVPS